MTLNLNRAFGTPCQNHRHVDEASVLRRRAILASFAKASEGRAETEVFGGRQARWLNPVKPIFGLASMASEQNGSWLLAIDHAGVLAEIGLEVFETDGPGLARFHFASLTLLYAAMPRLYELAASLPDAETPLATSKTDCIINHTNEPEPPMLKPL